MSLLKLFVVQVVFNHQIKRTSRYHCVKEVYIVYVILKSLIVTFSGMEQKGMTFDHDFYVVVGKQCRTENVYAGHQHNIFI